MYISSAWAVSLAWDKGTRIGVSMSGLNNPGSATGTNYHNGVLVAGTNYVSDGAHASATELFYAGTGSTSKNPVLGRG